MYQCSDSTTGSPTFTISVAKEGESYRATCDSLPKLPPQTAVSEAEAIRAMSKVIQDFITKGAR